MADPSQLTLEEPLVEPGAIAIATIAHNAGGGRRDRLPRRVVDRDSQQQPLAARGGALGPLDRGHQALFEAVASADHVDPHVVGDTARGLGGEIAVEQLHQSRHLFGRPLPVVGREREKGEHVDPLPRRRLHRAAHGARPGPVSGRPRQTAPPGPAAVAVEDDGHVGNVMRGTLHFKVSVWIFRSARPAVAGGGRLQPARVASISASMWSR